MLDYIRGQVVGKSPTRLILEVAGIGYLLHIPLSTFEKIPNHGEITILTQLFIREDQIKVFGFATAEERDLFQLLLSVNGIGPNTAIMILSGTTVEDVKYAVAHEDAKALEKIKGVGKKTAERIILELKGIIKEITTSPPGNRDVRQKALVSDAVMALVSLGYGRSVAENAVSEAIKKLRTVDNVEMLVREALKYKA
ncbi:MAG: Holliday junction branch migration protein RuvA [Candidatus Brocadia sp. AMX2]|uniref:Holliday junction branch migration complex subunit RuvA n=1 Tax=Candidatus Brocadia sinica JPN1 TaxID=1197129 RepID=A0ABQ0JW09_9BACT|nr:MULTISPECIES: Holliday junction branch migration protein RuvA [Brocadia]KXK32785.1 MAG: holliday junction DNA helicase RuvA [Candidatus Brocadia sinica]MBC6930959.1 Holliday junction branch migration protein RuvA [Candidatus Brocadia sp.]MBL1167949.1 Holliday junction branch migration protein RuvA [Candidatus Brocadia sp. AMX1]NOG41490.1 Holliday junction branch migration protein RuvA [Planctomycetota bacterium]KAA0245332.1 MAG: Holliday junction branch migration protein RuvA [Candidatus Br